MKVFKLIIILVITQSVTAQQSFYDVYNNVVKLRSDYYENYQRKNVSGDNDSLLLLEQNSKEMQKLFSDMSKMSQKVVNLNFPDINFTDLDHKSYMISDLEGELVVNCNYPYCMKCISMIDSIQKRTDKNNIKVLVLFTELYRKDISFLKQYNENVLIGFVTSDTHDVISMKQGDDCIYFLDKNHRIEFYKHREHEDWTKFLDGKFN